MTATHASVAELQGLYGPFAFPELLLQKLWWRREFATADARLADGRPLTIKSPGRWNRLGGPDFRDAVLEFDGARVRGDVEVHLRAEDWVGHRHAEDAGYDHVILHVVLFPPREVATRGAHGTAIPILTMLPLLWHDLEEYATDEAIAALLNRAEHRIATELAPLPRRQLLELIESGARQRWREKVRFAFRRIERLGWAEACHQTALEILGYRLNRAGMLKAAGQWPLADWIAGAADPEQIYEALREDWAGQGVRPANHPRQRLRQYARWVRARPDWPQRLAEWPLPAASDSPSWDADAVASVRRSLDFPRQWQKLQTAVLDGAVGGTRADNLVSDGWLPLLAARSGGPTEAAAAPWWWAGYVGDLPDPQRRALRELALGGLPGVPHATGPAQGLLGWLLQREAQEARLAPSCAGSGA